MKFLILIGAWFSFGLGAIGAILPIVPTTPFLILSAFLFSKSSPRFHAWILSLPFAGPAVRDWQDNRVIRPRAKVLSVVMIIGSLCSIWFLAPVLVAVKIIISLILASVGIFVVTRKSA